MRTKKPPIGIAIITKPIRMFSAATFIQSIIFWAPLFLKFLLFLPRFFGLIFHICEKLTRSFFL